VLNDGFICFKECPKKNIICKGAEGRYNHIGVTFVGLFKKFQIIGTGEPWFQNEFYFDQKNKHEK